MLIRKRTFSAAVAGLLLLLSGVQAQHSVTFSSQSLCVVIGSTVKIPCKFTPDYSRVTERQWYRVQSSEGEPQDLRKDPGYSGRVSVNTRWSNCELTVNNVRVSDSGVYNFRFKTQSSDWISASSGVQLTVTDLQVKVDPNTVGQSEVKVTCSSTCRLNTHSFYWYRNDHYIKYTEDVSTVLYSTSQYYEGSYSCKVSGSEHRSPPVCVLGQKCWGVTYTAKRVCALKNTSVDLSCSYKYPAGRTVKKSVWFIKENFYLEPEDVRKDKEYQGRVQYTPSSQNDCSLRITNLRERDAQTYRFRLYTDDYTGKYTGEPGVSLSVTDLKVTVSDWYKNKKLSCITTCTLSNKPTYIWYKNGQRVTDQDRNELYVSSKDAGSFSCAVRGHEELRSPAVCVYDEKSCWSVTYSTQTICGLIGSSVDIHSYFTLPNKYKVMEMFWFIKEQVNVEPVDMSKDKEYQGRVQYTQSSQNDCSLRITNLTERDAQTYRFRLYTDDHTGKYTGQPGVSLSVTDLKVTVSDSGHGQIDLSCITTCTLSNKPTYIWYKNGQHVSECKSASCSVAAVDGAVSYICAVEGHDSLLSPPVYSPKNTTAVVLSSGDTVEGDSVTLSCSSDANPPVLTYSWFKQSSAADTLLITDQNYSISNISSQHTGLYYCTAHNQLGHHNSTPTHLDVFYPPRNLSVTVIPSVSGDMVTLLCTSDSNPNSSYTWYRKTKEGVKLIQNRTSLMLSSREDGFHYCTARNRFGSSNSSEWPDTSDSSAVKYVVSGFAIALVILVIAVILWMRFYGTHSNRRRAPAPAPTVRREENSKNDSSPVYGNVSAMTSDPTQTASPEDQDTVQYSSVFFQPKHTQEVPLYSTVQLQKALNQEEEVEYATVNLVRSRADR